MLYAERLQMVSPCASKHPRDLKKNKNKKNAQRLGALTVPVPPQNLNLPLQEVIITRRGNEFEFKFESELPLRWL